MPCSDNGQDEYENLQNYGVATSSAHIATMVACELARLVKTNDPLTPMARLWINRHRGEDAAGKSR